MPLATRSLELHLACCWIRIAGHLTISSSWLLLRCVSPECDRPSAEYPVRASLKGALSITLFRAGAAATQAPGVIGATHKRFGFEEASAKRSPTSIVDIHRIAKCRRLPAKNQWWETRTERGAAWISPFQLMTGAVVSVRYRLRLLVHADRCVHLCL